MRHRLGFKRRFLPDQAGDQHRVHLIVRRLAAQVQFVRKRKRRPPGLIRNFRDAPRLELRNRLPHVGHAGAVMPGGNRGSRGIDQEFRRARRGVRGAVFQFGRGIEGNVAERVSAGLPRLRIRRNGLIHRRHRRRGRDHQTANPRPLPARRRSRPALRAIVRRGFRSKISQREPVGRGQVKIPRVVRISRAFIGTAEPVQCILHVARERITADVSFQHIRRFRLTVQISGPCQAPLGGRGVFSVRGDVQRAAIKFRGARAIQIHPIKIAGTEQRLRGPGALRIFFYQLVNIVEQLPIPVSARDAAARSKKCAQRRVPDR